MVHDTVGPLLYGHVLVSHLSSMVEYLETYPID